MHRCAKSSGRQPKTARDFREKREMRGAKIQKFERGSDRSKKSSAATTDRRSLTRRRKPKRRHDRAKNRERNKRRELRMPKPSRASAAKPGPARRQAHAVSRAEGQALMRVSGGVHRRQDVESARRPRKSGRPRISCGKRFSTFSRTPMAIRSPARACSIFSQAPARSGSRRSRAARCSRCLSKRQRKPARLSGRMSRRLQLTGVTKIFRRDATKLGPRSRSSRSRLVFADPPYGKGLAEKALTSAREGGWLAKDALLVVEEAVEAKFAAPEGFEDARAARLRRYGDCVSSLSAFRIISRYRTASVRHRSDGRDCTGPHFPCAPSRAAARSFLRA